jgi:phage tail-like protein
MANARNDPYADFNFIVEIDAVTTIGFSECSGLDAEIAVIEYREGNEQINTVRKIPGLVRYGPIVLKRGLTKDRAVWNWFKQALNGNVQRRAGSIILLDEARQPALRWTFREGWPSKWIGPALNARSNSVAIETLVIEHEGIDLVE